MEQIALNEALLRLGVAILFGGLIGFERERANMAAGLRTHILVWPGLCPGHDCGDNPFRGL